MAQPQTRQYSHDRTVLLFLAINAFLVFLVIASLLLRLGGGSNTSYFSAYRSNLGLSAFQPGGVSNILAFIGFAVIVYSFQFVFSKKLYRIKRDGSLVVLFMTTIILFFALVIGNALLGFR